MKPKNMPYYCGPRITSKTIAADNGPSDDNMTQITNIIPTVNQSFLQLLIAIAMGYLICPSSQSNLENLTALHLSTHMHRWTTRFPPLHSKSISSIGLFTPSGVGTSCPALPHAIFLSASNLPATSTHAASHFYTNLQHVLMYSAAGMSFSIISNHLATVHRFMDTWFIIYVLSIVWQLLHSGSCNWPLSLTCNFYAISKWWWQSSFPTMTDAVL